MKAISALNNIHKKGLFGDFQNINENKLVKISEVKELQIFQIVHYKKSNVRISSLKLTNLYFPVTAMQVNANNDTRILWSGPNN